jgi:hypothetical protein
MGRQINFYMDEDVESAFVKLVLENGQILCDSENMGAEPMVITEPSELLACSEYASRSLYQPTFGDLTLRPLDNGKIMLEFMISPVIQYSRTLVDHNRKTVRSGRLWVEMKYWDAEGNLVTKPEELAKWYESLARWVMKHLDKREPGSFPLYWCPSFGELLEQGYKLT